MVMATVMTMTTKVVGQWNSSKNDDMEVMVKVKVTVAMMQQQ